MNVEKKMIRSDIPGHHAHLAPSDSTRRMVVERGISISAANVDCDHLSVEGTFRIDGMKTRRVDVAPSGLFSGAAEAQDAMVAGRFDGKLSVTGRLVIRSTARITGEIVYGSLEIDAGARIEGKLTALPQAPVEMPAPKQEKAKQDKDAAPRNNVEKLFDETSGTPVSRSRVYRRTTTGTAE